MNRTIVTCIFVALALLFSTTWSLVAVKILLTGCLIGWLARTIILNAQTNAKKTANRKKRVRRVARRVQEKQAGTAGH